MADPLRTAEARPYSSGDEDRRGIRTEWTPVILSVGIVVAAGCGSAPGPYPIVDGSDRFDLVISAPFDSAGDGEREVVPLPVDSYRRRWWGPLLHVMTRPLPAPIRIDPALEADPPSTGLETVVVTFVEDVRVPRLVAQPLDGEPWRGGESGLGPSAISFLEDLEVRRAGRYARLRKELARDLGAQVLDSFRIAPVVVLRIRRDRLRALVRRNDVLHVGRAKIDASAFKDSALTRPDSLPVAAGRGKIRSDHYFDLHPVMTRIGVLDTGVEPGHDFFSGMPPPIVFVGDCTGDDPECDGPNPVAVSGHGTNTAAVLSANRPHDFESRGVTASKLDCFGVYEADGKTLSVKAVLRAFEQSVCRFDRVIVAEMEELGVASIELAAHNATRAGAVVVAAAGNNGLDSGYFPNVGTPAHARQTFAAGAYYVQNDLIYQSTSWGRSTDGRTKPDVMGPTGCWTALGPYSATSGATPFVAGAAALLRDWLVWASGGVDIDPGQVCAQLILSGNINGPFDSLNREGAGRIALPAHGRGMFGKRLFRLWCG